MTMPQFHPLKRIHAWFSAIVAHDTPLLDDLLAHGVPIDVPHPLRHTTALMEATRLGRTETVQWLIERGAAPAFLGGSPARTALHCALKLKRWEIAIMLTQGMNSCAMLDGNGATVLHMLCAASYDQPEPEVLLGLTTVFIGKGCPLDALDQEGTTALHHCVINDQLALAELLLEHSATPDVCIPDSGVSPLHIAALEKNMEMAHLLIYHGANASLPTRDGSTASSLCAQLAACIEEMADHQPIPQYAPEMVVRG